MKITLEVPSMGSVNIDYDDIPIDYYCNATDSENDSNFLFIEQNGVKCLLCSNENAIALSELICDYMLNIKPLIRFHNEIVAIGMEFWFLHGCECQNTRMQDLPSWLYEILNSLVAHGTILKHDINNTVEGVEDTIFAFPEYNRYLESGDLKFSNDILKEIDEIIDRNAKEYVQERVADEPEYFDSEQRALLVENGWL